VELLEIKPAIVIKTRRPNRSTVYINICISEHVPYNTKVLESDDKLFYLVCGEVGIAVNGHSVYDFAVNPKAIVDARYDQAMLARVSFTLLLTPTASN
jgi:hypothetical protein